MLDTAIKEAQKDYADKINKSKTSKALFITGIAGNEEEGYISTSQFLHNGKWEVITENGAETTALLSKSEIEKILQNNDPHLKDVEISNEEFFKAAYEINGIFHENGIIKDARARYISAILLAISKKPDIDLNPDPIELVNAINTRVNSVLKKENKEDFSRFIHIDMPSSEDNHVKLKTAIVKAVEILYGLNIGGMMQSGKDLLGTFYETFLKYGNGAKDLGIVLTPRHITRFAAEVMDIQPNDLVLDPTCGTGGFLVAAFDEVKKKTNGIGKDFENFKQFGLYGIEEQDSILALALVNMIFRGDGKNNMIEGDCFVKWLNSKTIEGKTASEYLTENNESRVSPITKVLMNPPFPKKKTDKKEYLFVEHALKQMDDSGLLFSVLPYACMIKGGKYKAWRLRLIKENTLLSVVTFPPELFQPVAGVRTVGIFIKKGIPQKNQKVLWLRTLHDGLKLKKGKRLQNDKEPNDLETIKERLKYFLKNPNIEIENEPEFQKVTLIDYNTDDKKDELELCPEAYLDEKPITQNEMSERIEKLMRENIAFNIKFEKELSQVKTNDS